MIYLDHASTTPLRSSVIKAMEPWITGRLWGNPSSIHDNGRRARQVIDDCRDQVSELLNCKSREVVFTSGATEANMLALRGSVLARKKPGALALSQLEHSSVIENAQQLEREGTQLQWIKPDSEGFITINSVKQVTDQSTHLMAVMLANNETGHMTDLPPIAQYCRDHSIQLHCDATQAVGHVCVDVENLGVHTLSLSGHKIGGPQGVGVLVVKGKSSLAAVQRGGQQEFGLRAGTQNVAGIVGLTAALQENCQMLEDNQKKWLALKEFLMVELKQLPGVVFNSPEENGLPHLVNVSFKRVEGEALLIWLDMQGVCVSSGSACHADNPEPSHVLKALGRSSDLAQATVRFSFGPDTTQEELNKCSNLLKNRFKLVSEVKI